MIRILELIGEYVILPAIEVIGWIFDHPIPFSLTLIAGALAGSIIGYEYALTARN